MVAAEFTGTIAAANPSSGAASVDWSRPGGMPRKNRQ